jgi:antitoxin (DNA-binding transcriptional repressor) of toxin-antitoxin stability system
MPGNTQPDSSYPFSGYHDRMKTVSISQTKKQFSALIEQVRQGEMIVTTDHDRPVAKLVLVGVDNTIDATGELSMLERKGIIRRGNGTSCLLAPPPKLLNDVSALWVLLDERQRGR